VNADKSTDRVNILLIDDQPAKLLSYEVILGELGENLIKANSPQEALGILLRTDDVAVVLIDVVMPGIDGFQLAAMIREHPRFAKVAIIFVSAIQVGETDHLRGYEIGAVDYVSVPVVPKVLRAKVRVFVDLYRKTRQLEALNAELEERVANRTAELAAQTEKLRRSEERRSIALSAGDMGSWEVDLATGNIEWDEGPYRIFGVDRTFQPTVERVEAMMHPEDRKRSSVADIVAQGQSRFQVEFRLVRPNGEVRWCYGAGIILRDAGGKAVRMNGVTVDITERKRAEERQVLLAREVDHRAKNTLAVVLSVLRLTKAPTTAEFITAVEGRVHALAATHNLLSSTRWEGADLRKIVEEEMAPYHATHRRRVITDGPAVVLLPATAQAVALALHELATNAAKYGALSTEDGTLQVSWKTGDDALELDWIETGGPPTAEPARLGFGLTIVRSSIEAQFRGGVSYDWRPDGLRCRLSIPAAQIVPAPPAAEEAAEAAVGNRARHSLAGMRLLVVEDELLVSMLLKDILADLGAEVAGPHQRLADGIAAARAERFDGAILDFNLAGQSVEPLADMLMAHGVPFVFITGYQRDSIDRRYANVPVLAKPIDANALESVLLTLLAGEAPARAAAEGG
jgi:PAS domain S-box-containing protein